VDAEYYLTQKIDIFIVTSLIIFSNDEDSVVMIVLESHTKNNFQ